MMAVRKHHFINDPVMNQLEGHAGEIQFNE
jgi:hypothetical protein